MLCIDDENAYVCIDAKQIVQDGSEIISEHGDVIKVEPLVYYTEDNPFHCTYIAQNGEEKSKVFPTLVSAIKFATQPNIECSIYFLGVEVII